MRGFPKPDVDISFLRADQVSGRLEALDNETEAADAPPEEGEDEDGVEPDGVRDINGVRQRDLELDGDGGDAVTSDVDGDDPNLSEYEDRRRLRAEEGQHERRSRRLGIIQRSLRLERMAYRTTMAKVHPEEDAVDIVETLQRYDVRLAKVADEQARVARMASRLRRGCEDSVQEARRRKQERDRFAAERAKQRRQQERHQQRELQRRQMEAEEARAVQRQLDHSRREKVWLSDARRALGLGSRQRRILGELDITEYPVP